jgi:hypothetical protein
MANIQKVLGRHVWREGYREERFTKRKREVLKCVNCARIHDLRNGDPSVVGCISDIDLSRLGHAAQKDQLERDMRGGLYS